MWSRRRGIQLTANREFSLFGLPTSKGSFSEVTKEILERTQSCTRTLVLTPNVDHFIRWKRDADFQKVYLKADICVLDGAPLVWISRLLGNQDVERITGVDLAYSLIRLAEQNQIPVGIIGGSEQTLNLARENLKASHPALALFMTEAPTNLEVNSQQYVRELAMRIESKSPRIILLCLGTPKQEFFFEELDHFQISGTFLCVGATVDFLADTVIRAPLFMQRIGLEWFFRFMQEPRRLFHRYFMVDSKILGYLLVAPFYGLINRRLESQSHVKN